MSLARGSSVVCTDLSSTVRARWVRTCWNTLAATALASCPSVSVRKVPTPTQYPEAWTNELQAKADAMEGVRFYLPRPFVNVFESYPVATDVYLAEGEVSPDGNYVTLKDVRAESEVGQLFVTPESNGVVKGTSVPRSSIFAPSKERMEKLAGALAGMARPHAGNEDALPENLEGLVKDAEKAAARAKDAEAGAVGAAADAALAADKAKDAPEPAPADTPTGVNRRDVKNDNAAFAYQPLRGNMDIVYLPDFDEQYVVSSSAGLGTASFAMNLGQGWSLQGLNSVSDNSALTKRIFELIDTAVSAAKSITTAKVDSIVGSLAAGQALLARPQSDDQMLEERAGTPVLLRIVIVHYAAKGLYPVIKPRELVGRSDDVYLLDLFGGGIIAKSLKAMTNEGVQAEIAKASRIGGRFTVPVYPYQYISFNTFSYVSIEAVTTSGSPLGTIYDKTGTQGDPGDRQQADLGKMLGDLLHRGGGASGTDLKALQEALTKAQDDVQKTIAEALAKRQELAKVKIESLTLELINETSAKATFKLKEPLALELVQLFRETSLKPLNDQIHSVPDLTGVTVPIEQIFATIKAAEEPKPPQPSANDLPAALASAQEVALTEVQKALAASNDTTLSAIKVEKLVLELVDDKTAKATLTCSPTPATPAEPVVTKLMGLARAAINERLRGIEALSGVQIGDGQVVVITPTDGGGA